MEQMRETVEGALETILGLDKNLTEMEGKLGSLLRVLEQGNLSTEVLFDVFRIFSEIRFHLAEADEYQALVNGGDGNRRRPAKTVSRRPAPLFSPRSPLANEA